MDKNNEAAVIPGFAMFPVNDRMIYGPYAAVKIWATERFRRIDDHVQKVEPGGNNVPPPHGGDDHHAFLLHDGRVLIDQDLEGRYYYDRFGTV